MSGGGETAAKNVPSESDLFDDVIVKIKFEANGHVAQYEQLRRVVEYGYMKAAKDQAAMNRQAPPRAPPLTIMYYMGRPLESYTHDELVQIAREGWASYHSALETASRSMRLMTDLHRASRG
jgi:hypothetical protein